MQQEQGECSTSGRGMEGLRVPSRGMARGLGSVGGATLQRSKLDLQKETKTVDPKVDDGTGGGNNGNKIFNGGGGDNDGGDDDDYFDNFDGGEGEGDDGNFFRTRRGAAVRPAQHQRGAAGVVSHAGEPAGHPARQRRDGPVQQRAARPLPVHGRAPRRRARRHALAPTSGALRCSSRRLVHV